MKEVLKVYYQSEQEWWQSHLKRVEIYAKKHPDFVIKVARILGFERIYDCFDSTKIAELKAVAYYLAAVLAKTATDRHEISYLSLKRLYLLSPINAEESVWITTAMHVAKVPEEEQAWLNSQPCPCETLPHGFAPE